MIFEKENMSGISAQAHPDQELELRRRHRLITRRIIVPDRVSFAKASRGKPASWSNKGVITPIELEAFAERSKSSALAPPDVCVIQQTQ
jgi:hypothetical protein